jgi:hypothetical protein
VNRQLRLVYGGVALLMLLALVAASTRAERPGWGLGGGIRWSTATGEGRLPPNANFTPMPQLKRPAKPHSKNAQGFNWPTIVVLGAIGLGVAALFTALARRRRQELEPEMPLSAALDDLLANTLDDLRAERDPRRAVIRAYGRMERLFGAHGFPRKQSETPFEYLARILGSLNVSAFSVQHLTQLFQRAKFSTHEIDFSMKDAAIEALELLRAQLQRRQQAA